MLPSPGAWLVDSYPILRHVPGYLNQLKQWHKDEQQLFSERIDVVKKDMVRPCTSCYRLEFVWMLSLPFLLGNFKAGTGAGFVCEVPDRAQEGVRTLRQRGSLSCQVYVWSRF